MNGTTGGARKAEMLLLLGAVIMVVAPALKFFTLEGPGGSESFTGYKAEEGSPYILAAVVCGLAGLLLFAVKGGTGRKVLGAVAILGALFGGYAAFVDMTDLDSVSEATAGQVEASASLGVYIAMLGAIVALIGAIMALATPTTDTTTTVGGPTGPPPPSAPPPA